MKTYTQEKWKADGCTVYNGDILVAVTYCEGNRELHPSLNEKDILHDSEGEIGDGWEDAWSNAELIAEAPCLLQALIAIKTQAELTALTFPNAPGRGDLLNIAKIAFDQIYKLKRNNTH